MESQHSDWKFDPLKVPQPSESTEFYHSARTNRKIRYRVCGSKKATKKVVFVMGLATPLEGWNEAQYLLHKSLEGEFLDEFESVVFDNAGSGLSWAPLFHQHNIRSMSEDAWDLIDHAVGESPNLGWRDVHLVSVSMGGMIAMEMALSRPDRVVSLTLVNTHTGGIGYERRCLFILTPSNIIPPRKGVSLFTRPFVSTDVYDRLDATLNLLFGSEVLDSKERSQYWMDRIFHSWSTRPPPQPVGSLQQMFAIGSYWISSWRLAHLKASKVPVFVHVGQQDCLINPDNSRYIARHLGSSIQEYETSGHALNIQDGPLFVTRLKDAVRHTQALHSERPKSSKPVSSLLTFVDYTLMRGFWLLIVFGLAGTVFWIFATFFSRVYTYSRWFLGNFGI